jgi:methionyl aminopeptidase
MSSGAQPTYSILGDGTHIYSEECLPYFKESAHILVSVRKELEKSIQIGITTLELNQIAEDLIIKNKAEPLFKNYKDHPKATPFPFTLCTSNNEDLVHGLPNNRLLENGDVLSIDIGVKYNSFCSDSARTYIVGEDINNHRGIIDISVESFNNAFNSICSIKDPTIGDIGYAINKTMILSKKYKTFNAFTGHGIGLSLHESPIVPCCGFPQKGVPIKEGMCFCIEPVVIYKDSEVIYYKTDGVSQFKTSNSKPSSHYENQVFISKVEGPVNLTID